MLWYWNVNFCTNRKATRQADKGGSHSTDIPKGTQPIPLSLKHSKIKQFQYTFSPLKSTGKTRSG